MICQDLRLILQRKRPPARKGTRVSIWKEMRDQHGHPKLAIRFEGKTCRECRSLCTRAQEKPRPLSIRSQEELLQLQRRREQLETEEFQVTSAKRAGIEGPHSEASAGARMTPISL